MKPQGEGGCLRESKHIQLQPIENKMGGERKDHDNPKLDIYTLVAPECLPADDIRLIDDVWRDGIYLSGKCVIQTCRLFLVTDLRQPGDNTE